MPSLPSQQRQYRKSQYACTFCTEKHFIIAIQKTDMIALTSFPEIQLGQHVLRVIRTSAKNVVLFSNFQMDFVAILKLFRV